MSTNWSTYNSNLSRFLQEIGKKFDEIICFLIQKGDDDSLMKAALAIHSIEKTYLDLCVEIVRRTDNRKILSQVNCNMYTTGVVSGDYGLAEAYEEKAKALEKYTTDESVRVRKFAKFMIKSFLQSAKSERQEVDEESRFAKLDLRIDI